MKQRQLRWAAPERWVPGARVQRALAQYGLPAAVFALLWPVVLAVLSAPPSAAAGEPPRVAAVTLTNWGNSILHGTGASAPARGCVPLLTAALGLSAVERPEWTGDSNEMLGKIDRWLTGPRADIVLLNTSTHDVNNNVPVAQAVANSQTIVARISAMWGARVVLIGPWGVDSDNPLNAALGRASFPAGVRFVPLAPAWIAPGSHVGGDGYHPNDAGHALIAAILQPVVRDLQESISPPPATSTPSPVPATAMSTPTATATVPPTTTPFPTPTLLVADSPLEVPLVESESAAPPSRLPTPSLSAYDEAALAEDPGQERSDQDNGGR